MSVGSLTEVAAPCKDGLHQSQQRPMCACVGGGGGGGGGGAVLPVLCCRAGSNRCHRSIRVLGITRRETLLADQRSLLVAKTLHARIIINSSILPLDLSYIRY